MAFFRAYIAPFLIVLIFLLAMLSVSARIFLPSDMMAPAPVGVLEAPQAFPANRLSVSLDDALPPDLSVLLHGQPDHA